jgi:anti-sigma factor RsiW
VIRLEHQTVMRYYDGELSPAEARALDWRLASDPELRRVLAGLEQIGAVVAGVAEARASAADDIAEAVMQRVGAEASGVRPRLAASGVRPRLKGLAGGATAAPAVEAERPNPAVPRRIWTAAAGLAAAFLAAAAAGFAVYGMPEKEAERPVLALSARPSDWASLARHYPAVPDSPPTERVEAIPAVAIESVDFGTRNGAIFMIPGDTTDTPVVWLVDEPAVTGDRMALP